jgi:hypothetical protein
MVLPGASSLLGEGSDPPSRVDASNTSKRREGRKMKFTICGSARFEPLWHEWNKRLGLMGHISYSLFTFPSVEGGKDWYTKEQKEHFDLTHLAKIEESDAILVLNKGGYVGESTRREVAWAKMRGKRVFWLEPQNHHDRAYSDILGWGEYFEKYGAS